MRILITGSNGMLGSDLIEALSCYELSGLGQQPNRHPQLSYVQIDITNQRRLAEAILSLKPAIVIHTAAYTDVDGCETNPSKALSVNVKGTEFIAEACNRLGASLIFISSDYVFDGSQKEAYDEENKPNPINVYGKSKYEAEEYLKKNSDSALILRSSWLYGSCGKNFIQSVMNLTLSQKELRVVNDQSGAPTYTKDFAFGIKMLIERASRIEGAHIYHMANGGITNWFDIAKKLLEKMNSQIPIKAVSSSELNRPAKRPKNSALNLNKIKNNFGIVLRNWEDAFDEFWNETLEKRWQDLTVKH